MNERIRELAWQAGFGKDKNEIYTSKLEHLPITDDIEKFAELIVRECSYRCYLTGEYQMAHELSDLYGFKFDFKKMMEEDDE